MERDAIERHIANWTRKQMSRAFGFKATSPMPLNEFTERVYQLTNETATIFAYAPKYPSVKVAETNMFHWNVEEYDRAKRRIWNETVSKLAREHLSDNDYRLWEGLQTKPSLHR